MSKKVSSYSVSFSYKKHPPEDLEKIKWDPNNLCATTMSYNGLIITVSILPGETLADAFEELAKRLRKNEGAEEERIERNVQAWLDSGKDLNQKYTRFGE